MLSPFGPGLPSDRIAHRFGVDGSEPRETDAMAERNASLGIRSTFVINTCYVEIGGGSYENRALYVLIDQALRSLGLFPVLFWDVFHGGSLIPIEGEGQLLVGENYALTAADQSQRGFLQIWRFYVGGGGRYYRDNVVFDLILPEDLTRQLVDEVEKRCQAVSVRFNREPAAVPIKKRRWFWQRRRR
jgi:hypothetical protein